jgi:hypothetical protein
LISQSRGLGDVYKRQRAHFDDYFQLTHEYRGHKLKKFGV